MLDPVAGIESGDGSTDVVEILGAVEGVQGQVEGDAALASDLLGEDREGRRHAHPQFPADALHGLLRVRVHPNRYDCRSHESS